MFTTAGSPLSPGACELETYPEEAYGCANRGEEDDLAFANVKGASGGRRGNCTPDL
jgi:hypothetical protein